MRTVQSSRPGRVRRRIRQGAADRTFDVVNTVYLLAMMFLVLYPLVLILSSSFSQPLAVTGGKVWLLPVKPSLIAYEVVFRYKRIWTGYANSFFYMATGTVIGVCVTILAAFPLSRKDLRGRKVISTLLLIIMLFNGGLIPTYLVVRGLNMIDTVWAIVLPGAASVWNIIIMRTYFQNQIPAELYEAAEVDGCSDARMLFKIYLPLSGAIIAVISLYYAVWLWNSYFNALIYINTEARFPLQIILRDILIVNTVDVRMIKDIDSYVRKQGLADVLRFSLIVVASVPLLVIYPFVQRYFIKGVMIGSIKG